jgi:hypothetical protein
MALPKRIKVGGGYFKGAVCSVASGTGEYFTVLTNTDGAALNGLSVVPTNFGPGDTFKLEHRADLAGTGKVMAILAEDINNVGAGSAVSIHLPAAELVGHKESVVFTYNNVASVAMDVYLIADWVGVRKTA